MNLVLDIGNTRTKLAIFDGEELLCKEVLSETTKAAVLPFLEKYKIRNSIISDVRLYDLALDDLLKKESFHINLSHLTEIPIKQLYRTPETLGNDRLASVIGASHLYPNKNVLVIDAGTCIKYDFVDEDGQYHGGSISPGLNIRFKALNTFTGKLPLVEIKEYDDFIGKSTEEAILTGVLEASIAEIEGFISRYMLRFTKLTVLITGGDADFFVQRIKNEIFAHPNLVLIGLNKTLMFNAKKAK